MKFIINAEDLENVSIEIDPPLSDVPSVWNASKLVLMVASQLLVDVLSEMPLLRPASKAEQSAHIYVFNEGEKGEAENALYRARKSLYDKLSSVIGVVLGSVFPDIEYIKNCEQYGQNYCMDHSQEEIEEYAKEIEEVTTYVRTNFKEVLEEVFGYEEEASDTVSE